MRGNPGRSRRVGGSCRLESVPGFVERTADRLLTVVPFCRNPCRADRLSVARVRTRTCLETVPVASSAAVHRARRLGRTAGVTGNPRTTGCPDCRKAWRAAPMWIAPSVWTRDDGGHKTFRVPGGGPGMLRVGVDRRQVSSVGTLSHRDSHSRLMGSEPKAPFTGPGRTESRAAPTARRNFPVALLPPRPCVPSGVGHGRHPEAVAHSHVKRTGTACPHPPSLRGMPAARESRAVGFVPWLRTAFDTAVPAVPGRR